jgi:hypothetical protein
MRAAIVIAIAICTLCGCSKTSAPAGGRQATVSLNDGTTFSGTVTSSSASAISLQNPSGESRTYPMSQVSSVQYAQQQPATVTAQLPANASNSTQPPPPPLPVQPAPPPVQPVDEFRTIPAGSTLEVRNNSTIDSETAQPGQTYSAVIERAVIDTNGRVAIPRGANAMLVVRAANGQGTLQGRSDLAVDVASVDIQGRHYRLETSDFVERGKEGVGKNERTGKFVGGGAALGGIIGAIAGGGKGAAIGALSGAGAGTATQGLTRGKAVRIPSETLLTFRLEAPVRIHELR